MVGIMDFSKLCCCTCDITKPAECLWHLRTTLEYDVKSLENETKRLKNIKEQRRQEIDIKAQRDGESPMPILKGWLERVEMLEIEVRSCLEHPPDQENTMIVNNNNTQEEPNSQNPPPTTCFGRLCYKNWFKPQENTNTNTQEEPNSQIISPPTTCLGGFCYKNWYKADKYQKRVVYLCQQGDKLLSDLERFNMDDLFVEDLGRDDLPLDKTIGMDERFNMDDLFVEDLGPDDLPLDKTIGMDERFNMDDLFVEDLGPDDLPLDKTIGMDEIFYKVWQCLQDKDGARKRIIGIHGMAGVGKARLLKIINNNLTKTTNHGFFDQVLWIDELKGSDVQHVQLAIQERLELKWGENASLTARAAKINTTLKSMGKCVLLIDDLQKGLNFITVGVPNETKVVFTTTNKAACSAAEVETFQLNCLEEKDAWVLFEKHVGKIVPEIVPLAEQVIQLCDGLPLALVTIGKALSGKSGAEDWEHAIEMLSTQAHEYADIDQKVYNKIRGSYEFLDTTAKPCFLYCSLFPNVCLVEEEELILYWFAENLIPKNYGDALSAILNQGKSIITNLKDVYLLKNVESEETIAMHDMVRGTAKWIASECGSIRNKFWVEYNATLTELPADTNSTQVLKISLVGCVIEGSMILECPNLSTLILKKSHLNNIRNDFFQSMGNLMVLDLSGGYGIISLPNHITSLTNLQYLNLSNTNIYVLPEDFRNLEKLKYLDLSYMNHLQMIPIEVISKLMRLKFLNMYHSGLKRTSRGVLSGDGEDLMRDLNVLENLVDLGITIKSDAAFEFLQNSRHMKYTHSLFIANCEELESLQLQMNVKVLGVLNCSKLRDVLLSIKQDSLRRVDIEDCDELNSFDWLKHACNLRFLRIVNCVKIEHIISAKKMEKKQVNIDEIEIECESSVEAGKRTFEIECESIANAEERMKTKQVNVEYGKGESLFSKLKHLHLENLPMLKTICGHDLEICALEQIKVVDCPQLKKLPLDVNSNSKGALKFISGSQKWWDNLQMEEDTKSIFTPYFRKN